MTMNKRGIATELLEHVEDAIEAIYLALQLESSELYREVANNMIENLKKFIEGTRYVYGINQGESK